jgi:hypothetical protein
MSTIKEIKPRLAVRGDVIFTYGEDYIFTYGEPDDVVICIHRQSPTVIEGVM